MTLTPCDFALAAIAAPLPLSRLTSSSTLAPFVIACSACCCWADLSPSAFWIVASTPALSKAAFSSGRSTVSQRTDDLESGSSTATLPAGLEPPPPPPELSSLPQPAAASARTAIPAVRVSGNRRVECLGAHMGLFSLLWSCDRIGRRRDRDVGLASGELERAEDLGAVAQHTTCDAHVVRGGWNRVAMDGLAQGIEQDVSCGAHGPADDDELWVEGVDDGCDRAAEDAAGVGDRAARAGVALAGGGDGALERELGPVARAQQLDDRGTARERLQAAAVAAAADRAALVDEEVPELAGGAAGAA